MTKREAETAANKQKRWYSVTGDEIVDGVFTTYSWVDGHFVQDDIRTQPAEYETLEEAESAFSAALAAKPGDLNVGIWTHRITDDYGPATCVFVREALQGTAQDDS